jgi:Cu/Ag efflux protein CusF
MKRFAILAAALALATPVFATPVLAQGAPMVSGTVKKVDASAEKITLKHERIPNLDMDSMTMVFKASDKAMLGRVKAGDKVKFTADRVNGQLTITGIEKAK